MNEEKVMNEVMETEEQEFDTIEEFEDEYYDNGGFLKKLAVGVVGTATAVGGVVLVKNKEKLKEWKKNRTIAKLEKEGYVVEKPVDVEILEADSEDQENTEE